MRRGLESPGSPGGPGKQSCKQCTGLEQSWTRGLRDRLASAGNLTRRTAASWTGAGAGRRPTASRHAATPKPLPRQVRDGAARRLQAARTAASTHGVGRPARQNLLLPRHNASESRHSNTADPPAKHEALIHVESPQRGTTVGASSRASGAPRGWAASRRPSEGGSERPSAGGMPAERAQSAPDAPPRGCNVNRVAGGGGEATTNALHPKGVDRYMQRRMLIAMAGSPPETSVDSMRRKATLRPTRRKAYLGLRETGLARRGSAAMSSRFPAKGLLAAMFPSTPASRSSRFQERVLRLVEAKPGLAIAEAARLLGCSHATANYHLGRLVERGNLKSIRDGRELLHFSVADAPNPVSWLEAACWDRRRFDFVLLLAAANPSATLSNMAHELGTTFGFLRRVLLEFEAQGLVKVERRSVRYVIEPQPTLLAYAALVRPVPILKEAEQKA